MMENSISHYCFVNMSALWISDEESAVRSMLVCVVFQFPIQLKDIWLKIHLEFENIRAGPLYLATVY